VTAPKMLDVVVATEELMAAAVGKKKADERFADSFARVRELVEALGADPHSADQLVALTAVHEKLRSITAAPAAPDPGETPMANPFDDVIQAIDQDANAIGAEMAALRGRVKTGMSQEEVDSAHQQLTDLESRLKALAADPSDPVPTNSRAALAAQQARQGAAAGATGGTTGRGGKGGHGGRSKP
jgi:small-conductance mechanosensitive channel